MDLALARKTFGWNAPQPDRLEHVKELFTAPEQRRFLLP
jgi:hypothetical protein